MLLSKIPSPLTKKLEQRQADGNYRKLPRERRGIDFSSNDYLGLSDSSAVHARLQKLQEEHLTLTSGSTGSRLLTGNSTLAEELEHTLATYHRGESALLFNSGYVANLGVISSIPQRHDVILFDELCHASIRDALRICLAKSYSFRHNSAEHLEALLRFTRSRGGTGEIYIVVESLYSVDGDLAPLQDIVALARRYGGWLIVDEAHSTGIYGERGEGLTSSLELCDDVLIRIHTFGKAIGCHGAVVVSRAPVIEYLVNFSRPFIYATALSPHAVLAIRAAYDYLPHAHRERAQLWNNVTSYQRIASRCDLPALPSPIQTPRIPGNRVASQVAVALQDSGFDVRAILAPTVQAGSERLRVVLHANNSENEIAELLNQLQALVRTLTPAN